VTTTVCSRHRFGIATGFGPGQSNGGEEEEGIIARGAVIPKVGSDTEGQAD